MLLNKYNNIIIGRLIKSPLFLNCKLCAFCGKIFLLHLVKPLFLDAGYSLLDTGFWLKSEHQVSNIEYPASSILPSKAQTLMPMIFSFLVTACPGWVDFYRRINDKEDNFRRSNRS